MSRILQNYSFPSGQRIQLKQGDITEEKVDAIVNAANRYLQHGGGVAGAIVRRGGIQIQEESDTWVSAHGPVPHNEPAYTGAGKLPCRFVIHAVGPIWGEGEENQKLAAAISGSLVVAEGLGLTSIAFPAISTGIFGFPKERAAKIILTTFQEYFKQHPGSSLKLICVTLIDPPTITAFQHIWYDLFHS